VEAIEKLIGHPIPPFNVEGLDPVDWAEDDGRRRRGRGRTARPKATARAKPAPREKPAREKPTAERPVREKAAAPPRAAKPKSEARPPPPREAPPREPRRRDGDTGATVRGFGEEVPAFMFLRRRHVPAAAGPATEEAESEA
jgi:hypothetical protein